MLSNQFTFLDADRVSGISGGDHQYVTNALRKRIDTKIKSGKRVGKGLFWTAPRMIRQMSMFPTLLEGG